MQDTRKNFNTVMKKEHWKEEAWQAGGASSAHKESQLVSDDYSNNRKQTRHFFKSPLIRSFLIAFLLLGVAAAIHFLTAPPSNTKRKTGIYNAKDGSVYQVEEYLKKELAHPESFQAIHWSTVEKSGDLIGTLIYKVSVIYKAIDKDGKPFMSSKMFELDEAGNVWMVMDVDPFRSSPAQNTKQ